MARQTPRQGVPHAFMMHSKIPHAEGAIPFQTTQVHLHKMPACLLRSIINFQRRKDKLGAEMGGGGWWWIFNISPF